MKLWVYKDLKIGRKNSQRKSSAAIGNTKWYSVRNADSCWHFGVGLGVVVTLRLCRWRWNAVARGAFTNERRFFDPLVCFVWCGGGLEETVIGSL